MGFDYPITRPYPWRFSTLGISAISAVGFILILYFNLAIVGTETKTFMSTNFTTENTPSWTDRMNIATMINFNLGCDPATLIAGSSYRTANGAFTYKAQSFVNRDTQEVFSSIGYNASTLNNCTIDNMGMFANSISFDALFSAAIKCLLPNNITMRATAESLVTLREDVDTSIMKRYQDELVNKNTWSTYLAPAISTLLAAFGIDYINRFLGEIPDILTNVTSVTTVYAPFTIGPDTRFFHLNATFSSQGRVQQGPGVRDLFTRDSLFVFENFAYAFWSGIMSDLGISGRPNLFTDANLFDRSIRQNLTIPTTRITLTWLDGTGVESVMRNKTQFRLPFENIQETSFNAQYLCRNISWKAPAYLIVDVLVATVSFFQLFWSAVNVVAGYFAAKSSVHGNHCTCDTCENSSRPEPIGRTSSEKPILSSNNCSHYVDQDEPRRKTV